jgi:hypothetical protein
MFSFKKLFSKVKTAVSGGDSQQPTHTPKTQNSVATPPKNSSNSDTDDDIKQRKSDSKTSQQADTVQDNTKDHSVKVKSKKVSLV